MPQLSFLLMSYIVSPWMTVFTCSDSKCLQLRKDFTKLPVVTMEACNISKSYKECLETVVKDCDDHPSSHYQINATLSNITRYRDLFCSNFSDPQSCAGISLCKHLVDQYEAAIDKGEVTQACRHLRDTISCQDTAISDCSKDQFLDPAEIANNTNMLNLHKNFLTVQCSNVTGSSMKRTMNESQMHSYHNKMNQSNSFSFLLCAVIMLVVSSFISICCH